MRINSKITFEKHYAIYKRKDKLGEVKSEDFIEFCMQLKLADVKQKHIICHNLTDEDMDKAFHLIEPPKKKSIQLLGYLEKSNVVNDDELEIKNNIKFNDDDLVIFKTNTYDFREEQIVSINSIRKYYADGIIQFMLFAGYIEFYRA